MLFISACRHSDPAIEADYTTSYHYYNSVTNQWRFIFISGGTREWRDRGIDDWINSIPGFTSVDLGEVADEAAATAAVTDTSIDFTFAFFNGQYYRATFSRELRKYPGFGVSGADISVPVTLLEPFAVRVGC